MSILTQESRIIMAMEAIQTSRKRMSRRAAAKLYDVPETTLRDRITSRPARQDVRPNRYKLTNLEEEVLIQYILDLDSRGFAPWLDGVEDIANLLLKSRRRDPVGKLWAY